MHHRRSFEATSHGAPAGSDVDVGVARPMAGSVLRCNAVVAVPEYSAADEDLWLRASDALPAAQQSAAAQAGGGDSAPQQEDPSVLAHTSDGRLVKDLRFEPCIEHGSRCWSNSHSSIESRSSSPASTNIESRSSSRCMQRADSANCSMKRADTLCSASSLSGRIPAGYCSSCNCSCAEQRAGFYAGFGSNSRRSSSDAIGSKGMLDPLLMVDSLAMPGGQTDVYAYLIYSTFRASSRWQLAQAVLGMLVTFLMQLGIVVLLWFGVITSMHRVPPTPAVNEPGWRTIVSSVEMPLAVVNMLVIFALAVYALEEIRKAANLSITAAACFQILPRFYLGESFSSCSTAGKGLQSVCYGRWSRIMTPVLRLLVLAAPLCQHLIGLLVLLSGIDLTFLRTNTDIVQIILDAAALIFLLELDSRVGTVLFEQHLRSVPSMKMRALSKMASSNGSSGFGLLPRTAGDVRSSGGGFGGFSKMVSMGQGKLSCRSLSAGVRMRLGHVYIALVGLFVLFQPLFLSSISMLGIHAAFMVNNLQEWKANRGPLTLWTLYGDQGLCIANSPSLLDYSPLLLPVVYPMLVTAMVLLLCGNMLPSVCHYWSLTMLSAQVVIGLAPHILACGPRSALLLLPGVIAVAWVVLFVVWPIWWAKQDEQQQEAEQQQQEQQELEAEHAAVDVACMAGCKDAACAAPADMTVHMA